MHQPADLLELVLQKLCQSLWDLEVYLASPAGRRLGTASLLAEPASGSGGGQRAQMLAGLPWLRRGSLGPGSQAWPRQPGWPPPLPSVRLFCVAVAAGVRGALPLL